MAAGLECVIFDAGNVLYTLDLERLWGGLSALSGKSREKVREALYGKEAFEPFERGLIPPAEFYRAVRERLDCGMSFGEFAGAWNAYLVRREEVFALARRAARRLPIAVLSNTNELDAPVIERDLRGLTDRLVFSFRVGLLKPDPRIYRFALARFGLAPGRTLFVDDLAANVDAARLEGLKTHLFVGADLLAEELDRFGL